MLIKDTPPWVYHEAGDPALIAGYIGKSYAFDDAIADHGFAYADQTEADYDALKNSVARDAKRSGINSPSLYFSRP